MRLIIREYISMLKESKELDALLVTLLLSMGIDPWSRPQIGVRQDGVDIAATGKDPDDGKIKVFLFVIKQGDIDRGAWSSGKQSVRPSLEEVLDVYVPNRIPPEFSGLPVKIVLCCGGIMRQEVEPNWSGFAKTHTKRLVQLSFWGADNLTILLEKHLLNEFIFPVTSQKQLRKVLATIGDPSAGIEHFSQMVAFLLKDAKPSSIKKAVKTLKTINLGLQILFHWCQEENNLNPAYLASERTLLSVWDWLRVNGVWKKKAFIEEFKGVYRTYLKINTAYFAKLRPSCLVQDGLGKYAFPNTLELHLSAFDSMGRLATYGVNLLYVYASNNDEGLLPELDNVARTLTMMIRNNPILCSPAYDGHSIEIALVLYLFLSMPKYHAFAKEWIVEMIGKTKFSYSIGCHYPISTDSFDDLLEMSFKTAKSKEDLTSISTLFPFLAEFCALLQFSEGYVRLCSTIEQTFKHTDLQMWFPDDKTEDFLYNTNAGPNSGATYCSITLPPTLIEMQAEVAAVCAKVFDARQLSCISEGMPSLAVIASRHYRTPMLAYLWQQLLISSMPASTPPVSQGGQNA